MSDEMESSFGDEDEWRSARRIEKEFVAIARTIKDIADEHGITTGPVTDCLTQKGLKPTLELISSKAGKDLQAEYKRRRLERDADLF